MTITELQSVLRDTVRKAAQENFQITLETVVAEVPPKTDLGDLAFPIAFELTKQIKQATGEKQNPRNIAETLKTELESNEFVDRVEVAGAGYLNVFFDRARFLADNLKASPLPCVDLPNGPKVCVEHTSVNPNKSAHIGHVRNSVLGDTFQRILKATGKRVEVQNYIDNTGVQVADVVVGFMYVENRDLESIKALDKQLSADGVSFDFYCWDLYAKVGQLYQTDDELKSKRAEVLHLIEEGNNATAELADYVATRNVECITNTMERLSIRYDLLPRESEILHLHFWNKAFEQMKERGVIQYVDKGKHAGCWVMPFESHEGTDEHEADKILVRSNGTVTYTGKDIAYQMWKLGVLGMDFHYKPFFKYDDGKEIWITTDRSADTPVRMSPKDEMTVGESGRSLRRETLAANGDADKSVRAPKFGRGEVVYNVIDSRQSYPQEVVKKGVAAIHPEIGESASVHLSYEMVALSPAAAEELGFEVSDEDRKKPFIEMSGRKGLGVKADDLITRLEEKALVEVESRHSDSPVEEKKDIAHQIAVGALRYFLLKFTRNTVIVFDFNEALSFEGETGCFVQYSAVRANSIFRKLDEQGQMFDANALADLDKVKDIFASETGSEIWSMLTAASRLQETVESAASQNEPAILAKYTFNLAKAFNLFYRNHKIISEANPVKRSMLIAVADTARRSLTAALDTMGISVPEKM
jgi:arginyl-tRNA synthetase